MYRIHPSRGVEERVLGNTVVLYRAAKHISSLKHLGQLLRQRGGGAEDGEEEQRKTQEGDTAVTSETQQTRTAITILTQHMIQPT